MSDENERSVASAGSVPMGSLSAFVAWRDEKLAKGEHDVNPYMVWCAGVRYAALTDAEREFLQALHNAYEESANRTGYVNAAAQGDSRKNAAIIRGLLERLK